MEEFYKCSKIEVLGNDHQILVPKQGECSLKIFVNYGVLTLKVMKSKVYFNKEAEEELTTHEVSFILIYPSYY